MRNRAALLAAALSLLFGSWARADVSSRPVKLAEGFLKGVEPKALDDLARLYFAGDPENAATLQTTTAELLEKAKLEPADVDIFSRPVSIVFASKVYAKKGEEIRFFLESPYAEHLPGLRSFHEIFLSVDFQATLSSAYSSSKLAGPLAEKLPKFIQGFDLSGLAKLEQYAAETRPVNDVRIPANAIYIHVSRVDLPFRRAKITITDEITIPTLATRASLDARSRTRMERLQRAEARVSKCAIKLATELDQAVRKKLQDLAGPPVKPSDVQWKALGNAVEDTLTTWLGHDNSDGTYGKDSCRAAAADGFSGGTGSNVSSQLLQNQVVMEVASQYRSLVTAPKAATVKGTHAYENVPLARFGLGLIASVITENSEDVERVKLDGGKLSADPLTGTMSLLVLNIHPRRFDSKADRPSPQERFRLFVGASVSPEFGVAAGLGYGLVRGLSINAGFGLLRVDGLKTGDTLGVEPTNANSPFTNKTAEVVFFGLGYNF